MANDNKPPIQKESASANPNTPKNRLLRLVVGMAIVILGVVIFNVSSKLYAEAEAREAEKKAEREQKIRELTEPTDSIDNYQVI